MAGYFSRSGGRKVSCAHLAKSRRGQVASLQGTRSGHDIVYRIGSRMSGHPSCATHVTAVTPTIRGAIEGPHNTQRLAEAEMHAFQGVSISK